LPAVLALGIFLPFTKEAGKLLPQHRWLPIGWFALWITATVVHLYSRGFLCFGLGTAAALTKHRWHHREE
jgi:hypothetical protein